MAQIVAKRTIEQFESGSAIRRMFEEGLRLKKIHGADQVADLSIGNPEFDPPEEFKRALARLASAEGPHAYMPNAGYPHVRERVAEYLNRQGYFDGLKAEHVIMTTGAAGALNVVLQAVLSPGDEVIVPKPYFVEYRFYVESHGGTLRLVDTTPDFDLDVDAIAEAVTTKTRAVIVNSPNNPTGRIYPRRSLEALSELLTRESRDRKNPILLISDEPYREVVFDRNEFVSPASVYANSFMCYSWSKSFSISGERIGYLAVNPKMEVSDWPLLTGSLAMCNRFLGFVNAPALMQRVIAESIDAPIDISHYAEKRRLLQNTLEEAGFTYAEPQGAFYLFVRAPEDEGEFVARAARHLLLVVPGADFGAPGNFRISYAAPTETIELACRKLAAIAAELKLSKPMVST